VPFEVLDGAFVLLGSLSTLERAEVLPFSRLRIFFSRVQPVSAALEFSDHRWMLTWADGAMMRAGAATSWRFNAGPVTARMMPVMLA
jgi:hypothetical protein